MTSKDSSHLEGTLSFPRPNPHSCARTVPRCHPHPLPLLGLAAVAHLRPRKPPDLRAGLSLCLAQSWGLPWAPSTGTSRPPVAAETMSGVCPRHRGGSPRRPHLDLQVLLGGSPDAELLQVGQPVLSQGHSVLDTAVLQEGGVGDAGRDAGISSHDVAPADPHSCGGRESQHPGWALLPPREMVPPPSQTRCCLRSKVEVTSGPTGGQLLSGRTCHSHTRVPSPPAFGWSLKWARPAPPPSALTPPSMGAGVGGGEEVGSRTQGKRSHPRSKGQVREPPRNKDPWAGKGGLSSQEIGLAQGQI